MCAGDWKREIQKKTILVVVPTLHFPLWKVQVKQLFQHKVNGRKEGRSYTLLHHLWTFIERQKHGMVCTVPFHALVHVGMKKRLPTSGWWYACIIGDRKRVWGRLKGVINIIVKINDFNKLGHLDCLFLLHGERSGIKILFSLSLHHHSYLDFTPSISFPILAYLHWSSLWLQFREAFKQ